MFPGLELKVGDAKFIVPALSLGQLRNGAQEKLKKHDELLNNGDTFAVHLLRGEIILTALRRNYPDLDENKIMDHLDLQNTRDVWLAVLGMSGFTPGETVAATTTEKSGT